MAHVQKRLHANIQTTINTYVHLTDDDLQQEYQSIYNVEKRAMEIDRSYVNTLANDKSETSLTETELRLVDNTKQFVIIAEVIITKK